MRRRATTGTGRVSAESKGVAGIAVRYATALFELAEADKRLDRVAADLDSLNAMIDASGDLRRLIRSPVISRQGQTSAIAALMERAGLDELTRRFVGIVAANRRLFALPAMIRAYKAILAGRRGEATAEVASAKGLSEKQLAALASALEKAVGTAVSIQAKVDPHLLGGLVVKVGSRMVDSSLKTKLQQLRLAMKA